ncbi:hypothetical protein QJQ45_017995 [Haematococcus lacustris]|nr:hypothetical protein QJQ45_017995 [Haematococcus lacustris]
MLPQPLPAFTLHSTSSTRVCPATACPDITLHNALDALTILQLLARALDVSEVRCRGLCASKPHLLLKDPEAVKHALQEARRSGQLPPPPRP